MKLILAESQKMHWKNFWTFLDEVDRLTKSQNSDFQCHFSMSKIVRIFLNFFFIEEFQFRTPTFVKNIFDKFNFENNLFLKLGRKIVIFF